MIAVSVRAETINDFLEKIKVAEAGDFIELRGDYLENLGRIEQLAKYGDKLIITIRRKSENGKFDGTEEERLRLFKEFFKINPKFIDIEFDSVIRDVILKLARVHGFKVIVSYHNFTETPSLKRLIEIGKKMIKTQADVIKVVTYASKVEDNLTILRFIKSVKYPVIAFCMGDLGKLSRIFSPFFGSFLTYASVDKGKETAPGQLTVNEIKTIWRIIYDRREN